MFEGLGTFTISDESTKVSQAQETKLFVNGETFCRKEPRKLNRREEALM
jgi:hypothetical protein